MNGRQMYAKPLTEQTVAVLAAVTQAGRPNRPPGLLTLEKQGRQSGEENVPLLFFQCRKSVRKWMRL